MNKKSTLTRFDRAKIVALTAEHPGAAETQSAFTDTHDEMFSVAIRVHNPDHSPFGIHA